MIVNFKGMPKKLNLVNSPLHNFSFYMKFGLMLNLETGSDFSAIISNLPACKE